MRSRPLRPCPTPGCPELVAKGRCPAHTRALQAGVRDRAGTAAERGYGWRWQQYTAHWLARHPFCGDRKDGSVSPHSRCRAEGRITGKPLAQMHVDHIQRVTGPNDPRFWDRTNHQTLCASCHGAKTRGEQLSS